MSEYRVVFDHTIGREVLEPIPEDAPEYLEMTEIDFNDSLADNIDDSPCG